jgi:hypothetical protein
MVDEWRDGVLEGKGAEAEVHTAKALKTAKG